MNSLVLYYIGHGDITPKPDVAELKGKSVLFEDGSEEAIDYIIYATGFKMSFPFLATEHLKMKGNLKNPSISLDQKWLQQKVAAFGAKKLKEGLGIKGKEMEKQVKDAINQFFK